MATTAPSSSSNKRPPKPPPPPPPPIPFSATNTSSADNNNNNNSSGGLPPKPVSAFRRQSTPNANIPRPFSEGGGPKRRSSASSVDSGSSASRRAALLRDVSQRLVGLTRSEATFLNEIVVHGTDEEVELAHENFDTFSSTHDIERSNNDNNGEKDQAESDKEEEEQQKVAQAWLSQSNRESSGGADESVVSSLRSSASTNTQAYLNATLGGASSVETASSSQLLPPPPFAEEEEEAPQQQPQAINTVNSGVDSIGSERRQELLQLRKEQNQALWDAHEKGLALTKQGSRRSLRSNSLRFAGTNARSSAIFRRGRGSITSNSALVAQSLTALDTSQNSQPRRGGRNGLDSSIHSAQSGSHGGIPSGSSLRGSGNSGHSSTRRPSLRRLSSDNERGGGGGGSGKPALRRLLSDSSRKSVTFVDVPHRDSQQRSSSNSGGDGQQRRSLRSRSGSFNSIPSIHLAYPIRSNSIRSITSTGTTGTFPLLPHVRAMRSSSFGSQSAFSHSSYYPYEGRDPSNDEASTRDEEKKVEDLWPSVPSKVEIRKDGIRQTDNSAKYLAASAKPNGTTSLTDSGRYESTSSEYFHSADDSEVFSITNKEDDDDDDEAEGPPVKQVLQTSEAVSASKPHFQRPVLMRDVSIGEGVEVADFAAHASPTHLSPTQQQQKMMSEDARDGNYEEFEDALHMANSYDETMSFARMADIFRRPIKRSLSDEAAAGLFVGPVNVLRERDSFNTSQKEVVPSDGDSWQMDDDDEEWDHYDSWLVIEDEYENGFGGGGTLPFQILGTSASDTSAHPHVLSPPLMESLQQFLPFSLTGENFWLKYSMVRDGASMHAFLRNCRNARFTILAVETLEGEVFGAFLSESWRKSWNYFGTGESFLWRMRHNRGEKARSILDQAHKESELEVFPFTGENSNIMYCTNTRLAVGGGAGSGNPNVPSFKGNDDESVHTEIPVKDHEWGYGLSIQGESLLQGTSSPCLTFGSPPLSKAHADGSLFEVMNIEVWTLTPWSTEEEAEKQELSKLFLEKYRK